MICMVVCKICFEKRKIEISYAKDYDEAALIWARDGLSDILEHGLLKNCKGNLELHRLTKEDNEVPATDISRENPENMLRTGTHNISDSRTEENVTSGIGIIKAANGNTERS